MTEQNTEPFITKLHPDINGIEFHGTVITVEELKLVLQNKLFGPQNITPVAEVLVRHGNVYSNWLKYPTVRLVDGTHTIYILDKNVDRGHK